MNSDDFDIMGNMTLIENYKTYLLSELADLYVSMSKENKIDMDDINDEISSIIILSYLLSKRLGLDYGEIDERIVRKLKAGLIEGNNAEKEFQDYSKLVNYIKNGREK